MGTAFMTRIRGARIKRRGRSLDASQANRMARPIARRILGMIRPAEVRTVRQEADWVKRSKKRLRTRAGDGRRRPVPPSQARTRERSRIRRVPPRV